MNGFGMGLGWFIPLLLIVALIYFFMDTNRRGEDDKRSPKEILDMRFAKGEIDKEEYISSLKALK
jgi:putative membrane protein